MQTLPNSPEAEYALVGCVLAHAADCAAEISELAPGDFYHPHHRAAWAAIRALADSGRDIDAITVADELSRGAPHGLMDGGPMVWCVAAMTSAPIVEQASRYARIVKEAVAKRRLIALCAEVSLRAADGDLDECMAAARMGLADLETYGTQGGPVAAGAAMGAVLDAIEGRADKPEDYAITTGLRPFDEKIGGLKRGQLIVVAGPPGMGKTALGISMAHHAVMNLRVPALVVSLEMDVGEVVERFLSQQSSVPGYQLASGQAAKSRDSMSKITIAAKKVAAAPLWVEDRPLRLGQILGECRRWYARNVVNAGVPIGLLIIDYLGLIAPDVDDKSQSRALEVARMTRSFKNLAKELRCPLVLLSQLNRQYAQTERPELTQLRDSGAIEQDANAVLFPWREVRDGEKNASGPAEIIVAKNRNGPVGTIHCWWQAEQMKFVDEDENSY